MHFTLELSECFWIISVQGCSKRIHTEECRSETGQSMESLWNKLQPSEQIWSVWALNGHKTTDTSGVVLGFAYSPLWTLPPDWELQDTDWLLG